MARIEASQDGSPYIYVTFTDPKEYKPGERQQPPFGQGTMAFTSIEDLMKNMPKVMANISGVMGGGLGDSPTMKISMREYEDMSLKVGDKVTIDIQKTDTSGI